MERNEIALSRESSPASSEDGKHVVGCDSSAAEENVAIPIITDDDKSDLFFLLLFL